MLVHWLEQEGKKEMLTSDELGFFIYMSEIEKEESEEDDEEADD